MNTQEYGQILRLKLPTERRLVFTNAEAFHPADKRAMRRLRVKHLHAPADFCGALKLFVPVAGIRSDAFYKRDKITRSET